MKTERREFVLSDRLSAVFVIDGNGIRTEFRPFLPPRFTPAEAKNYQIARRQMLDALATAIAPSPIPGRVHTA